MAFFDAVCIEMSEIEIFIAQCIETGGMATIGDDVDDNYLCILTKQGMSYVPLAIERQEKLCNQDLKCKGHGFCSHYKDIATIRNVWRAIKMAYLTRTLADVETVQFELRGDRVVRQLKGMSLSEMRAETDALREQIKNPTPETIQRLETIIQEMENRSEQLHESDEDQ